ncbi:hypothetical protein BBO_03682 [Beauveria brongniartii RCEF 3172]|uniref:Uncharacterized protein n=1 Tax=Beauveria brongniartii RCEF 3172 TaxID=1081107 RepID=A0A167FD49_9HYPO|nr:hypothetical protein BBO_03682 [Beauveria brongniartii RCEF 3172]
MATATTTSRRFEKLKYSLKVRPFTNERQANFTSRANNGTLNRPYDPERNHELRQIREGSMASEFDHLELQIREERVDLTWEYPHHDIEMPTAAQIRRLAPCVRRTMRVWEQTPHEELYSCGPAVAPLPKIPDPSDDTPEWGFRDKHIYRRKQKEEKKKKKQKQKKKRKSRTDSEHPEDVDLDFGHRPKRSRVAEEEVETGEHEGHLPLTPAQTPRCIPNYDCPVPSIEDSPGAIARADANIALISAFNNAQTRLCASPAAPAIPLAALPSAATAAAAANPGPPQFAKDGFFALPHQVRLQIYRYLLDLKQDLHINILLTCAAAFDEAAAVLYGENQFLYLLRDGVNYVADDDAPHPASDVEEELEGARQPTMTTRRGRKPLEKCDINLPRYICRMRRICLEAEHNRFADEAQNRATSAVKIFTDRFEWLPDGFRTRLASIELRVVPVWEAGLGDSGSGGFTFLDWFDADTELMRAVRNLSCDKMTVRLLPPRRGVRSRRGRGARSAEEEEEEKRRAYAHEIDMHDYQVGRLVREHAFTDPWHADEAMHQGRAARMAAMEDAFDKLRGVLEGVCRDIEYGERGCPRVAEGSDDDGDEEQDGADGGEDGQGEEEEELFDEEIIVEQDDENDGDYEE